MFGAFDGDNLMAMAGFRREPAARVIIAATSSACTLPLPRAPPACRESCSKPCPTTCAHFPEVVVVNLSVRTTNDAARALHRRPGFNVTGIDKRDLLRMAPITPNSA